MLNDGWSRRILALPEFNLALFALLLNYPWEFIQIPFFEQMPTLPHGEAVLFCTRAALGDVLIALAAFWVVALARGDRGWLRRPDRRAVLGFVAVGLLVTVGLEWHATEVAGRWHYSELMPTVPLLGTGLLPLLQWLLLPPLVVWFARRQIRGQEALRGAGG